MEAVRDTFCNYNGHLISIYEPMVSFANRAFRYGDALFETIRVINGRIMFLPDHMRRIKLGMAMLRMNIPNEFSSDSIARLIHQLIKVNEINSDVRIRFTVFRNEGGFYTPVSNDISFLIETEDLTESGYQLNENGYTVEVYHEIKKPKNKLASLKSGNALIYVLAGIYKKDIKMDDVILLNEDGNICESVSSNIFFVKNGALYTPSLSESCVEGVLRKQVLEIAQQNRILCYEINIPLNTMLNSDEIFLTNAIQGVRWVGEYKTKNYQNKMAIFMIQKLNELSS
ncbi:MAG: aminotransferase class IV [Bacteroidota bacterium]|jgi:branched-subunit amino acid aminotransferase/4-amino-4-deoxychorismate lyase